jgi:Ca-activated chloride channel family protein
MDFAAFHFIRPVWLLALLPAVVAVVLVFRSKLSKGSWTNVCDAELLPFLLQENTLARRRGYLAIGSLAAFLCIFALAGPTWQREPSPAFRNASALVVILDLSKSMDAEDIKPSRLIRARYKIADLLKQRKDGQTALIVYAGDAFTVTPLTDDNETIANQLSALTTDIMPSPGSDTAIALDKALALFNQAGLQKGQIILLTDGVDSAAVSAAKKLGAFQLSVLGIGTADGAPIPLADGGFMKDDSGAIIIPKLDQAELAQLAQAGQGAYQSISTDDADIQKLLAITSQPTTEAEGKAQDDLLLEQWQDLGPWLLLLILPASALLFRKGVLCLALVLLLPMPKTSHALEWQDLWQNKDQRAQAAYNNKQYKDAAELFENPDWKNAAHYKAGDYAKALEAKPSSNSEGIYNQGNALAQSGQLKEALAAYEQALKIDPNNEDARFNKELVEKELKKQEEDKKQDKNQDSKENKDSDKNQNQDQKTSDKPGEDGQKPEQKPEQKADGENPDAEEKPKQNQTNDDKQAQPEQNQEQKAAEKPKAEAQEQENKTTDEKHQADEQWLKRIPDDPAGLLKRKFKYQYGERGRSGNERGQTW